MISNLPEVLEGFDDVFTMNYKEPVKGYIIGKEMPEYKWIILKRALAQELCQHDACFFTFNGSTLIVISTLDGYCILIHIRDPRLASKFRMARAFLCLHHHGKVFTNILQN